MTDILEYAKLLDFVGSKMLEASANIPQVSSKKDVTFEELIEYRGRLVGSYGQFVESRNMLGLIIPPEKVKGEHEQLIAAYDEFLVGSKEMISSVDIANGTSNRNML